MNNKVKILAVKFETFAVKKIVKYLSFVIDRKEMAKHKKVKDRNRMCILSFSGLLTLLILSLTYRRKAIFLP